jgi:PDZ domain-containing secreted protein
LPKAKNECFYGYTLSGSNFANVFNVAGERVRLSTLNNQNFSSSGGTYSRFNPHEQLSFTAALGDVIVAVNDTSVRRLSDLTDELERNGVGKMVPLTVQGAIRPERSKRRSSTSAARCE